MIRLRTSLTFEFKVPDHVAEFYETSDPVELARFYQEDFEEEPGHWYDLTNSYIDGTARFSVEPVE
jgi:hypothetical protein